VQSVLNILAQATPPVPAEASIKTILELAIQGGLVMIPIVLVSIIALAIVVERLVTLRRSRVMPPAFLASLPARLDDPDAALAACKVNASPVANILATIIRRRDEPTTLLEKHVSDTGERELVRLRHRMRLLSSLPQVSTMLGLLGTIFGMIRTFRAIAASGEALGKTEMLAKGIHEAWVATASGLLVAIPVMVAYYLLQGRIDSITAELDRVVQDFVDRWHGSVQAESVTTPPHAAPRPHANSLPRPAASTAEPAAAAV
jgi:biopolymer transport protein ExbB